MLSPSAQISLTIGVSERTIDPPPIRTLEPLTLFISDGQELHSLVNPDFSAEKAAESDAIFCNACCRRVYEGLSIVSIVVQRVLGIYPSMARPGIPAATQYCSEISTLHLG